MGRGERPRWQDLVSLLLLSVCVYWCSCLFPYWRKRAAENLQNLHLPCLQWKKMMRRRRGLIYPTQAPSVSLRKIFCGKGSSTPNLLTNQHWQSQPWRRSWTVSQTTRRAGSIEGLSLPTPIPPLDCCNRLLYLQALLIIRNSFNLNTYIYENINSYTNNKY